MAATPIPNKAKLSGSGTGLAFAKPCELAINKSKVLNKGEAIFLIIFYSSILGNGGITLKSCSKNYSFFQNAPIFKELSKFRIKNI